MWFLITTWGVLAAAAFGGYLIGRDRGYDRGRIAGLLEECAGWEVILSSTSGPMYDDLEAALEAGEC